MLFLLREDWTKPDVTFCWLGLLIALLAVSLVLEVVRFASFLSIIGRMVLIEG